MAKTKELKNRCNGAVEGEESSHHVSFGKSPSRALTSGSSFQSVQRAFGHTRPFYDSRPQTWNFVVVSIRPNDSLPLLLSRPVRKKINGD